MSDLIFIFAEKKQRKYLRSTKKEMLFFVLSSLIRTFAEKKQRKYLRSTKKEMFSLFCLRLFVPLPEKT
jgi:hypothetical protein